MVVMAWRVSTCAATLLLLTGCTRDIAGSPALPYTETPGPVRVLAADADQLMLDRRTMRALTGADTLSEIPSMDGKYPVDIDLLARGVPTPCQFIFAETQTFGTSFADFHKTTYQRPPGAGIISQAAAVYPDPPTAGAAFESLVDRANACAESSAGPMFVGYVASGADSLQTRPARTCGRDYQLKSAVLVEVTFCEFPESVPGIVLANILDRIPG
jgi:PknH-like extracellular domain